MTDYGFRKSYKQKRLFYQLFKNFILIVTVLLITGCGEELPTIDMEDIVSNGSAGKVDVGKRPVLRIAIGAMISPETTRQYYEKLLELLASKLDHRAVFAQRRTYAEVNALIADKKVDVAFVCAGPYTRGYNDFGMELLVVPVAHGRTVYHSYILAHRDSTVQTLNNLRSKRFAFTDPDSNTGCLVPTYMLAKKGEIPESFFADTFFSGSHDNSIRAIADGMVDGAAVDSLIWEFMNSINPALTGLTRIVEKSPPYGIPPIVVHPDLPDEQKKRLRRAFLNLHQDASARVLLSRLQIDYFVLGDKAAYDSVREMRLWVEKYKRSRQ